MGCSPSSPRKQAYAAPPPRSLSGSSRGGGTPSPRTAQKLGILIGGGKVHAADDPETRKLSRSVSIKPSTAGTDDRETRKLSRSVSIKTPASVDVTSLDAPGRESASPRPPGYGWALGAGDLEQLESLEAAGGLAPLAALCALLRPGEPAARALRLPAVRNEFGDDAAAAREAAAALCRAGLEAFAAGHRTEAAAAEACGVVLSGDGALCGQLLDALLAGEAGPVEAGALAEVAARLPEGSVTAAHWRGVLQLALALLAQPAAGRLELLARLRLVARLLAAADGFARGAPGADREAAALAKELDGALRAAERDAAEAAPAAWRLEAAAAAARQALAAAAGERLRDVLARCKAHQRALARLCDAGRAAAGEAAAYGCGTLLEILFGAADGSPTPEAAAEREAAAAEVWREAGSCPSGCGRLLEAAAARGWVTGLEAVLAAPGALERAAGSAGGALALCEALVRLAEAGGPEGHEAAARWLPRLAAAEGHPLAAAAAAAASAELAAAPLAPSAEAGPGSEAAAAQRAIAAAAGALARRAGPASARSLLRAAVASPSRSSERRLTDAVLKFAERELEDGDWDFSAYEPPQASTDAERRTVVDSAQFAQAFLARFAAGPAAGEPPQRVLLLMGEALGGGSAFLEFLHHQACTSLGAASARKGDPLPVTVLIRAADGEPSGSGSERSAGKAAPTASLRREAAKALGVREADLDAIRERYGLALLLDQREGRDLARLWAPGGPLRWASAVVAAAPTAFLPALPPAVAALRALRIRRSGSMSHATSMPVGAGPSHQSIRSRGASLPASAWAELKAAAAAEGGGQTPPAGAKSERRHRASARELRAASSKSWRS